MVTTPTFWSGIVTFSNDIFASNPKVVGLSDDTFAIVWQSGSNLVGRHLDHFGGFTGGDFLSALSASTALELHNQQVFEQSNGALILNFSRGPSGGNIDVLWHQVNQAAPNSTTVNVATSGDFELLWDSDAFGSGSALAYRLAVGGTESLQLRYLNSSGGTTVGPITVGDVGGDLEDNAAIAGADTGSVVAVAYRNFNNTTFDSDVRMRVFNSSGTDVSGEVIVSGIGGVFPDVTLLGNGGAFTQTVVTWQDSAGIAFRHYLVGIPVTGVQVIPGTVGGFTPQIVTLGDLGYIIAWTQAFGFEVNDPTSIDLDIVLQRFDINGNAVGSKVFIDQPGDQALFGKSLSLMDDGRVLLAFESETGDGTNLTKLDYVILDPREPTISGDGTANTIVGRLDASTINGLAGADNLFGMDSNDTLNGGTEADMMHGQGGNDTYVVDNLGDKAIEQANEGKDLVRSSVNFTLGANVEKLVLLGTANLKGTGNALANYIKGNEATNVLWGLGGNDVLTGEDGKDTLVGGVGRDFLYGGLKRDFFDFNSFVESRPGAQRDKIFDFSRAQNDKVDLSGIDANIHAAGNQAFKFIGAQPFHDIDGELRFQNHIVQGDVNGDGRSDFEIFVNANLAKVDFFL